MAFSATSPLHCFCQGSQPLSRVARQPRLRELQTSTFASSPGPSQILSRSRRNNLGGA